VAGRGEQGRERDAALSPPVEDFFAVARRRVWISRLDVPSNIDSKIKSKHNLTADDVCDALVCQDVQGEDDYDERYGHRKIVYAETFSGQSFRAYLYILDEEEGYYRLGSAFEG
jgi:hypothetical protein